MNYLQRTCLVLLTSLAAACWSMSLAIAQPSDAQELIRNFQELNKRAAALYQVGKYAEAIPLVQQQLAILEKALGPNNPRVATAAGNLAALYYRTGRYSDAEPLFKRALAIMEETKGADHPDLALAVRNLAQLYFEQGRYAEAEPLYKRSLAIYEKALGPDRIEVAQSLNGLALVYERQNRAADAEQLYKRALTIWERAAGPNHPDVATALNNLAALYRNQGRYVEAEPLYKRSLTIREKALGSDHPDVAQSLNNLALLYADKGRYADAEPLYKRSLAIREKALGPDHPDVATTLNNLAVLYRNEARYADAEPLNRRALALMEKALGGNHPDVALALNNLALIYDSQGRYSDAEPLYMRSLAIWEKALGPDHPRVATALSNLSLLYQHQARYAEAEPLYKRALAIREKALAPDHPDLAVSLNNLAGLYYKQGRYAEAEPLYKQALAAREKTLGPDHLDVANSLNNLAGLYQDQRRYADAESLFKRTLTVRQKALGPDHPYVTDAAINLAALYNDQGRYREALPLIRGVIAHKTAAAWSTLPGLFGAQAAGLLPAGESLDESLNVVQRAQQTSAGAALNALAVRFSAGNDRLAELVRQDQDLAGEAARLDKAIIAEAAKEPSKRDAAAEQRTRDRIAAIAKERDDLGKTFAQEFPDYAALSNPQPLTVKDIQSPLADDEAIVIVNVGDKKSYIWAVTRDQADWQELTVTTAEVSKAVSQLRGGLDFDNFKPFDAHASFALYQKILAPIEGLLRAKARLSFVVNGALTSLPPQLLVTRDPTGKALKDVDWLIRTHAVTVLPSVASLKVLRGKSAVADAKSPLIGFANPVFDRTPEQLQQNVRVAANVTASRGLRGAVADIGELRTALSPLPDTANELREVAASVKADPADVILGLDATESRVKKEKLDQYRIVYFATHGLLAGDVADFAKLNAEPALVLSLPEKPTEFDDGLLTASEVAQLKLNADWVVLSACNTAAAEKPGAEALSGLGRAFFYAGARSLVASHWEVETQSAVALMVGTFSAFAADPKLSHAEALQKSILAMIEDPQHPERADPKYWAPFVVVGEPAKPAN